MADFKELQAQLAQLNKSRAAEEKRLFRTREEIKRVALQQRAVQRSHNADSPVIRDLAARAEALKADAAGFKDSLSAVRERQGTLLQAFLPFTDPRTNLGRLPDSRPILLFPVRLETRFKIVTGREGRPQHQLWVRIYPDVCSIDSFDDTLSSSEVERAWNYWTAIWKAGRADNEDAAAFVKEKEKGAWNKLMGLFNAGRAYWITQNFRPVNEAEIPVRSAESDVLLIIPTEDPPAVPVQAALKVYWRAVFLARADAQAVADAFSDLVAATGGDVNAARDLTASFVPGNLEPPPESDVDPAVQVAFLVLPKVDEKLSAWSQATRVTTFPERFVLLGYQDGPDPVIQELGHLIPDPLILGPDTRDDINALMHDVYGAEFDDLSDDDKAVKYVEYLAETAETRWLFDFAEAISMGLGFKIDLTAEQYNQGFRRLFVVGVKLSTDGSEGQAALEQLLQNHQFGDSGFAIVPQGTPTNNTEDSGSGFSETQNAEEAFDRYLGEAPEEPPAGSAQKRDGRYLAEALGIDAEAAALHLAENFHGQDQDEARALHTALWNATIGYFLESMITPVFSDQNRELIRWFLINYVRGRGGIPSIRIANQPYGILPVSTFSGLKWTTQPRRTPVAARHGQIMPFLARLYSVINTVRNDWQSLVDQVAFIGKSGDAHAVLLQALGLHANSVEFDRRIAQSFDQIKNSLYAQGVLGDEIDSLDQTYRQRGLALLAHLGYQHDTATNPKVPILERSFLGAQEDVNKALIDDQPLSETAAIRAYTDDGLNYIEWLIKNAREDHRNIKDQIGFTDNKPPVALLYDMLRQALNLEFGNTGLKLYQARDILNTEELAAARLDSEFISIQGGKTDLESKWDLVYRQDDRIAPNGVVLVDHISRLLTAAVLDPSAQHLQEVIDALEFLKDTPTARLERCFVEHLDCCSYRLDAWLLGLLQLQLEAMRRVQDGETGENRGIYLGAYGWVENLRPDDRTLTAVELDAGLQAIFDPDGEGGITRDDRNAGYVHAPSVNHALTAAVLRNAYISAATEEDAERYKVNLSSERVRLALTIIEGMQQGQPLAALLGYQLERGLHDNTSLELDIYIYELRKVFPLVSNRLKITEIRLGKIGQTPEATARHAEEAEEMNDDQAVSKVEARNVVNGLALLERARTPGRESYPFGFPIGEGPGRLKAASAAQRAAIDAEVARLLNVRDAVADLALAESVHQVVQGNYERAGGALDAFSKGGFPQLPDVIQSPGSGVSLTHRFAIHLPAGAAAGANPRSMAEPAVNAWLLDLLPAPNTIRCEVRFRLPVYEEDQLPNPWSTFPVTMADIGLEPIDLLYLQDVDTGKNLGALDDYVLKAFYQAAPRRLDLEVQINYVTRAPGLFSFFELAALIAELRALILAARPLTPSDIRLQNEAKKTQDLSSSIDPARIGNARAVLDGQLTALQAGFINVFEPFLDDEDLEVGVGNSAAILGGIDAGTNAFVDTLSRLSLLGREQTGSGFVFDRRSAIYAAVHRRVRQYRATWDDYRTRYQDIIDNRLPAATTDEERIDLLHEAERLISATFTVDFATLVDLQNAVLAKKVDFDLKYDDITDFLATDFFSLQDLLDGAADLIAGLDVFDLKPFNTSEEIRLLVVLAADMLKQAQKLLAAGTARSARVQELLDLEAASASATEKLDAMKEAAQVLFAADFLVFPQFQLAPEQAAELDRCLNDQIQLLQYQRTEQNSDFPLDDWLYGVARVREKLGAWENLVMLAEGCKERPPLDLTPFQLPFQENDSWLGLAYPQTYTIESDKLLYTAHAPAFDPHQPVCGILVDEWTEVIPAQNETTGMTFHYDRPNCEAPQSMLLALPSVFTGEWQWNDLVGALHETLDLAQFRALEPDIIDQTDYARLIPATVATLTRYPVTMALNYAQTTLVMAPING